MKKIIKGIIVPVVVSVLIGFMLGKYVFKGYRDNLYNLLSSSRLYLTLNGEYETLDKMRMDNNENNYVYYQDNDKYYPVVGITHEYKNIDKIKKLYDSNLKVMEYYVANDRVNEQQLEYDNELMNTDDIKKVREVVNNILKLYRNGDSVKLING